MSIESLLSSGKYWGVVKLVGVVGKEKPKEFTIPKGPRTKMESLSDHTKN